MCECCGGADIQRLSQGQREGNERLISRAGIGRQTCCYYWWAGEHCICRKIEESYISPDLLPSLKPHVWGKFPATPANLFQHTPRPKQQTTTSISSTHFDLNFLNWSQRSICKAVAQCSHTASPVVEPSCYYINRCLLKSRYACRLR